MKFLRNRHNKGRINPARQERTDRNVTSHMNVYRVIDRVSDFFHKLVFFSLNRLEVRFEIRFECDIAVRADCEL